MFKMFWQLFFLYTVVKSEFSVKLYLSVEENQKPNSPIGNLIKLIQNQTKSTEILKTKSFQLESEKSNTYGRHLISVDQKKGDIWVTSAIDREEICQPISKCLTGAFLNYIIFADHQIFELQIEIIDINDNFPSFQPDEKTIKIPENVARSSEFSLPVAKDRDSEKYGVKKYYLKSISSSIYENYFELIDHGNNINPYLRVIGDLDRENIKSFEFHLYASDGGGNQGKCRIIVEITDVNDNTPQWVGLPYRKEISECTTEAKVLQLNAQDKDDPQTIGGQIRFKISENSQNYEMIVRIFYITESILYLNIGALKSFKENKASIVVIAADGEGRSNETTIELEIKDCNDHRPVIKVHSSSLKIKENEKSKILVTRITVTDEDQGINSEFSCSLNDTNFVSLDSMYTSPLENGGQKKIFQLNSIPGLYFDREKASRYSVEVICNDNGTPTMSSSEIITIFISDENDNPPHFETEFKTFSISEDAKIGHEIGIVIAKDSDSSPNNIITYSIIGDYEVKETFGINHNGQIHLNKILDREVKDRYEFTVEAKDNGEPNLNDSCKIRIIVLDVNDNIPEISTSYSFKIVESWEREHKHFYIGKLNASDRDIGQNGTFRFRVRSRSTPIDIQVYNEGKIIYFGNIDREKVDKIDVLVDVIDNGNPPRTATTTVHIEVLDVNDNRPKFTYPLLNAHNYLNITDDMAAGSIVGEVKATDEDFGLNGSIIYNLTNQNHTKDLFSIQSDGQIILKKKLDTKIKNPDRLVVEARDQGTPSLSATTTLYIRYFKPRDSFDRSNENSMNSKYINPKDYPRTVNKSNGLPNNAIILVLLVVSIMMIVIVVGGIAIYIYCRGKGLSRLGDNNKHLSTNRDSNNVIYQKGCSKSVPKAENQINDTYNPVAIGTFQPYYTNLMLLKNNCFPPIDNSYQISQTMLTDNYFSFQPKSNTPTPDKENQEFSAFNSMESWNPSKHQTSNLTMQARKKTFSENSDNFYETEPDHKYAFIHPSSITNLDMNHELNNIGHFTTPSQSRRNDFIQSRSDSNQKVKINLVNSSFV